MRWKRTLLLVPIMVSLLFVAAVESGHPASGKVSRAGILLAALKDPLSLFAERSPGERTGAQLSTKVALAGPAERVLSGIRDRDPAAAPAAPPGLPELAGLGDPVFTQPAEALASGGGAPGDGGLPGGGGFPGGGGGGPGAPFIGVPFSPQDVFTPEIDNPPHEPPGITGPIGGGLAISAVPEPATWAMLILGFFAVGAAMRRRARDLTSVQ